MVDRLVPGVTTLTENARYFALYWAIADYAGRNNLGAEQCRLMVRRTEVALGALSLFGRSADQFDGPGGMHGADRIKAGIAAGRYDKLADDGSGSYSPRAWGFWSQYAGASVALGSVALDGRALRPGLLSCPNPVREMFSSLLDGSSSRLIAKDSLDEYATLEPLSPQSTEAEYLRGLLVGAPALRAKPSGPDTTRLAAFTMVARSVQLAGDRSNRGWTSIVQDAVTHGPQVDDDAVLSRLTQAQAWRGTMLRHHSVGAWRRMWSSLVDYVQSEVEPSSLSQIHEWTRSKVEDISLLDFLAILPKTIDSRGVLTGAESEVQSSLHGWEADLALLLIGARRMVELSGIAERAFRGNATTNQFLDPSWVGYRRDEIMGGSLGDFACLLVDDMLSQSQRVAHRKTTIRDGRFVMFTKLHEREGRFFASGAEGRGNVGLRLAQIGELCIQLGLIRRDEQDALQVTEIGRSALGLPQ